MPRSPWKPVTPTLNESNAFHDFLPPRIPAFPFRRTMAPSKGDRRHMEARPTDRMMRRTIALLVALADLAEQIAGRCHAVRFLMLILLRRAEALACDYVAGEAGVDGLWFDDGMEATSLPADALLLAERFRLLAQVLTGLLEPACPRGGRTAAPDAAPRNRASGGAGAAGWRRRRHVMKRKFSSVLASFLPTSPPGNGGIRAGAEACVASWQSWARRRSPRSSSMR
jgi:hypothetical protein